MNYYNDLDLYIAVTVTPGKDRPKTEWNEGFVYDWINFSAQIEGPWLKLAPLMQAMHEKLSDEMFDHWRSRGEEIEPDDADMQAECNIDGAMDTLLAQGFLVVAKQRVIAAAEPEQVIPAKPAKVVYEPIAA